MNNISKIIRPNIAKLNPYSSARGEYWEASANQIMNQKMIFLDANENPYPNVKIRGINLNRYPDPSTNSLRERIASLRNVQLDNIIVGNGTDEIIDLLVRVFVEPGVENILINSPTYGMYKVIADVNNVECKEVSLTSSFQLDVDAIFNEIDSLTRIIIICSPNNPTGNLMNLKDVRRIIEEFKGIVVIDEAYIDFADEKSAIGLVENYPNLLVLQTLSKAWAGASLRLGIGFGQSDIINVLCKVKPPYNVNGLSQIIGLDMLKNTSIMKKETDVIKSERNRVYLMLKALPLVKKVYKSDANFLLFQVDDPENVYENLMKRGIVVRKRNTLSMLEGCIRVSIGTPEENALFLQSLKEILK